MASTILLCRVLRERKAGRAGAELRLRGPILGGLVAVVVLVTGQLVYRPVTQIIRPVAETKKTEASRELEILGGKFKIKLDEVPMSGPSNAPHVVVALLDYTCYGCRVLHAQLSAAQGIFTNQLGVVTLPVPLDGKCNPSVTEVFPAHTNGCEYARIGLALWRANRNASQQYEGWVFGPPEAPPVAQSRAVAERLVGAAEWQKALADPWVEEQLKQDVAIYEVTYARIRNHSMPQLLVGTNLIFGSFANMEDLLKVLGDQFGLRRAP